MSIPTWSGEEHTLGTFRYRVLWFRVLLVAGVTAGLGGAFAMGHTVGKRSATGAPEAIAAAPQPQDKSGEPAQLEGILTFDCFCEGDENERTAVPMTKAEERELLEAARARCAELDAEREAHAAKNESLRERLDTQRLTLQFDQTPFAEALDYLRDITKHNYVVSSDARDLIEQEEVTVSLRLRGISAHNALKLVLAAHESLTYRLRSGVIRIETFESASELEVEAYDVADIVSGKVQGQGGVSLSPEVLIELIESLIESDEGSVEYTSGDEGRKATLVARRARRDQARIAKLLAYLRKPERHEATDPAWVTRYEETLATRKVTLNFPDTPLSDVVGFLQDITALNLSISGGVDGDETTVNLRLREVPLGEALTIILEQTGLARSYRNETLLIHDPSETRGRDYFFEVLDVRDLCTWLEPDALQELIYNASGEDHWDEPASLQVHRGQLLIRQTRAQHAEVQNVLAKLRHSRAESAKIK